MNREDKSRKKKMGNFPFLCGNVCRSLNYSSAYPDDDAKPVPFMTGASGRPGEPLLGTAVPKDPGQPSLAPAWSFAGSRVGRGVWTQVRRGAALSAGGEAASGRCGEEGEDAFTWRREDPGAPRVHPVRGQLRCACGEAAATPCEGLGESGRGCSAATTGTGGAVVREFLLPLQPRKVCQGGRAHSWPPTRSCFPATASAVLRAPARAASPSFLWLLRPAAALSPGNSSRPQPSPPHSPRRAPEAQEHCEGSVGATLLPEILQLCLLTSRRSENTQIRRKKIKQYKNRYMVKNLVLIPCP